MANGAQVWKTVFSHLKRFQLVGVQVFTQHGLRVSYIEDRRTVATSQSFFLLIFDNFLKAFVSNREWNYKNRTRGGDVKLHVRVLTIDISSVNSTIRSPMCYFVSFRTCNSIAEVYTKKSKSSLLLAYQWRKVYQRKNDPTGAGQSETITRDNKMDWKCH